MTHVKKPKAYVFCTIPSVFFLIIWKILTFSDLAEACMNYVKTSKFELDILIRGELERMVRNGNDNWEMILELEVFQPRCLCKVLVLTE